MATGQKAWYVITVIVGVLIQTAWAHYWSVRGTYPDFYLVLSVCAGLTLGMCRGAAVGLVLGYVEGIMLGQSVGSFVVSRATVAILCGLAEKRVYRDNLWVPVLGVLGGTIVGELIFLIMSPNYPFVSWTATVIKESIYNAPFALLFFPPLSYLTRSLPGQSSLWNSP